MYILNLLLVIKYSLFSMSLFFNVDCDPLWFWVSCDNTEHISISVNFHPLTHSITANSISVCRHSVSSCPGVHSPRLAAGRMILCQVTALYASWRSRQYLGRCCFLTNFSISRRNTLLIFVCFTSKLHMTAIQTISVYCESHPENYGQVCVVWVMPVSKMS